MKYAKIALLAATAATMLAGCSMPFPHSYTATHQTSGLITPGAYRDSGGNEIIVTQDGMAFYCQPSVMNVRTWKITTIDGATHVVGTSDRALPLEQHGKSLDLAGNEYAAINGPAEMCKNLMNK